LTAVGIISALAGTPGVDSVPATGFSALAGTPGADSVPATGFSVLADTPGADFVPVERQGGDSEGMSSFPLAKMHRKILEFIYLCDSK